MASIVRTAARKMRIIAIPLTKPKPGLPTQRSNQVLTYYQFQISYERPPQKSENGQPELASKWFPEEGVIKWVTSKATSIWAGFGKAGGGWKLRVFQIGEKLVDRLDFEELALNSIDPSLGPPIASRPQNIKDKIFIPLIYPPSMSSDAAVLSDLRALLASLTPRHRKGFMLWGFIAPLTAPFMIIPIIPNLPFFFCVWRSYSHYRAYRSSQYLQSLIDQEALVAEASQLLDVIYKDHRPTSNFLVDEQQFESKPTKHDFLLTRAAVPAIIRAFNLKKNAESDLYRAVEQARVRVQSGRLDL